MLVDEFNQIIQKDLRVGDDSDRSQEDSDGNEKSSVELLSLARNHVQS